MNVRASFRLVLLPVGLALVLCRPLVAQQGTFGVRPTFDLTVPTFSDRDVADFETGFNTWLTGPRDPINGMAAFWDFARGLQAGRLTPEQETRVMQVLGDAGRAHPADATTIDELRHMVGALTVGKAAPEIDGRDLDGVEFRLSDYRGKVVVLVFSGQWCGICRSQYPYEKLLTELYHAWPFAIVSVNSDLDRAVAKQALTKEGLTYRAWWDGYLADNTAGPIASAWNITGWPTVYVLDGQGTIRFI